MYSYSTTCRQNFLHYIISFYISSFCFSAFSSLSHWKIVIFYFAWILNFQCVLFCFCFFFFGVFSSVLFCSVPLCVYCSTFLKYICSSWKWFAHKFIENAPISAFRSVRVSFLDGIQSICILYVCMYVCATRPYRDRWAQRFLFKIQRHCDIWLHATYFISYLNFLLFTPTSPLPFCGRVTTKIKSL